MPTMKPVKAIAIFILFTPNKFTRPILILWAAPVSESTLPNKTPKPKINKVDPSVLPMPLLIDFTIVDNTIELHNPTNSVEIIKAVKAFNFTTSMSSKSSSMEEQRISIGITLLSFSKKNCMCQSIHTTPIFRIINL